MNFKEIWQSVPVGERDAVAARAGTTAGYLHQIAYSKDKEIELGLADVLVTIFDGRLTHADLPLTKRASYQFKVRSECAMFQKGASRKHGPKPTGKGGN